MSEAGNADSLIGAYAAAIAAFTTAEATVVAVRSRLMAAGNAMARNDLDHRGASTDKLTIFLFNEAKVSEAFANIPTGPEAIGAMRDYMAALSALQAAYAAIPAESRGIVVKHRAVR